MYLYYVDGLNRGVAFHWLADWHRFSQWHWSRSRRGGTLADLFLLFLPVSPIQITSQLEKMNKYSTSSHGVVRQLRDIVPHAVVEAPSCEEHSLEMLTSGSTSSAEGAEEF